MREVSEEYARVVKQIRKHVSDIMIIIKRAAHYLKPVKVIQTANSGVSFQSMFFLSNILLLTLYILN